MWYIVILSIQVDYQQWDEITEIVYTTTPRMATELAIIDNEGWVAIQVIQVGSVEPIIINREEWA